MSLTRLIGPKKRVTFLHLIVCQVVWLRCVTFARYFINKVRKFETFLAFNFFQKHIHPLSDLILDLSGTFVIENVDEQFIGICSSIEISIIKLKRFHFS